MNKLKLAHEYALKQMESLSENSTMRSLVSVAWQYADAMQAEADERNKAEAEQKRKEVREVLNDANTFIERKGQHFDDMEEREPDWSQAPDNAKYWAMDGCGQCNWYARKPEVCGNQWDFGRVIEQAHTGCGYQGSWQDSLRKRPQ